LLGSNKIFIVSEATVPGLRHTKQLVAAIKARLGSTSNPQVIVNRFNQQMCSSGLSHTDLEQVLGESFATAIPNDYALVREAIDRGVTLDEVKPGNKITQQLRKHLLPQVAGKSAGKLALPLLSKLRLAPAR
jgi:pilus assembly protein CpaE